MKTFIYRNRFLWASLLSFSIGLLLDFILSSCVTIPTCATYADTAFVRYQKKGISVRRMTGYTYLGTPLSK